VTLAAVLLGFFLAVPAEAAEGPEGEPGLFGWLISWIVGVEMAGATGTSGWHEGPYVDPNGRPGSCAPSGCGDPPPAPLANPGDHQGG
jgi:hypothetical protein